MILVVAATSAELAELQKLTCPDVQFLVAGVGLVETTFNLTQYLLAHPGIPGVINLGIAGAFPTSSVAVLDCCLATSETIGDLGVCFDHHMDNLDPSFLFMGNEYPCDNPFQAHFLEWFGRDNHSVHCDSFLSVSGVSGTTRRGAMINRHGCICENMEGAAVARVCSGLGIDWLEFRVVSNLVEDRDPSKWQIKPAIEKYNAIMKNYLQEFYS